MWEVVKPIIHIICTLTMCGFGGAVLWAGIYGLKHKVYMAKWECIGMVCWGVMVLSMAISSFIDFFFF